jgi:soluble lytic murein transglycosylase
MYDYWDARSLEQGGEGSRAREIFSSLAYSTTTNYYPAMAGRRVGQPRIDLPGAALEAAELPSSAAAGASFHLQRALALKALALHQLELAELRRLQQVAEDSRAMRLFLLAEFQAAGGYNDAMVMAGGMAARGEISNRLAERIRYPRAFWSDFSRAAARTGVKPDLLLSLARQESLFDPTARSIADARGVMQLLPSTAQKVAARSGIPQSRLDLYDPALNIELGSANLKLLLALFNGNQFRTIAAYNAGEEAVQRWDARYPGPDDEWVENIEYAETRNYVKKVVGGIREYQMLYPALDGEPRTASADN